MSYRNDPKAQVGVFLRTVEHMEIKSQEIISDLLISALLASLVPYGGANPTFIAGCITVVHSVHIPRALRAYREAKHDFPLENE